MSQQTQRETNAPAEKINGLEDLYPRQVHHYRWNVLSLRNDEVTAHTVDLQELTCTCADEAYNKTGQEVCDHVAVALFQAPQTITVEDEAVLNLSHVVRDAKRRLESFEQTVTAHASDVKVDGATVESEAADGPQDGQETTAASVTVEEVEDWLETGFGQPELVDVRSGSHNGQQGVVLEPDNQAMSDGVYESFKSLVNSLEDSNVHVGFGDDPCHLCNGQDGEFWYFVPETDSSEVWG